MNFDRTVPLRRLFDRRKVLGFVDEPMLSVYRDHGVIYKDERTNLNKTAEDRGIYQLVGPGWLVVNRMKAWQGSLGVSSLRGIVSGHYICFQPNHGENHRYLHYLLRSPRTTAHFRSISRGVRPGQIEIDNEALEKTRITLPDVDQQQRIADFLDDRVSRIDRIIAARREQVELAGQLASRLSFEAVQGTGTRGPLRDSDLPWLGSIPSEWPVLSVGSQFSVELGKMLDDKRQTGEHRIPYLRNTNVQWDVISVHDLKKMDIPRTEYARFTVRPGDLLICEGGQPGRSAIWTGDVEPLGFQKALHRARSRGRSLPGWLLECLRVAVNLDVFDTASGQTTIAHLTNEQLREQRFPFPEPRVQANLLGELGEQRARSSSTIYRLNESIGLLTEYKSSLITAAVTGELDVTTAGSNIPG